MLRALLVALEQWTRAGTEPPASRTPTLDAATAVSREQVLQRLAAIEGLALPSSELLDPRDSAQARLGTPEHSTLRALVSIVDIDGNECAGVILPALAVPPATHLGINPRQNDVAGQASIVDLIGTSHPFARNRSDRAKSGDPRLSLDERYAGPEDYADRVRVAAVDLAKERFLLEEDIDVICQIARSHFVRLSLEE